MLLAYAILCLIFGTTFLAIKVGIMGGFLPFFFAGLRFALAGLVTLAILRLRGVSIPRMSRQYWSILAVGLANTGATYATLFWAEQYLSSGLAAIFSACMPLLSMLLVVGSVRLKPLQFVGVAAGLAGVGLTMAPSLELSHSRSTLIAVIVLLAGQMCYAWGSLKARKLMQQGIHSLALNGLQMFIGGAAMLLASAIFEPHNFAAITPQAWGAFLYLLVIGSVVGHGLYFFLVGRAGALFAATWTYISPIIATFAGAWLLDESLTVATLLGVALALTGVAFTDPASAQELWRNLRPSKAASTGD